MEGKTKEVVIEYSENDGLKRIIADNNEMQDISAIQYKDIEEWFEESDGRDGWEGLIVEVKKFIEDKNSTLIFKFKGPSCKKDKLEKKLNEYGYELQDALEEDLFKNNLEKAKKSEERGNIENANIQLQKAADQNSPDALFKLAEKCYKRYKDKSTRIEENSELTEMLRNYKKAAINGNEKAQRRLAEMYEKGEFVNKNEKEACKWYKDLASKNDIEAILKLGDYCKKEKKYNEASKWYDKAAEMNNKEAKDKWGVMFLEGGVLYDKHNDKMIKKGLERVKDAAHNGYAMAQYNMGLYYKNGENGIQKDLSKAYEWFKKAAEQDNQYAQKNLGDFFLYGRGVPKDEKKACQWYEKSAKHENENAQASLGQYYYNNKQYEKAYEWLNKAEKKGHKNARRLLARMYENGEFVDKNEKRAYKLYKLLAKEGDARAQLKIGDYCKKEKKYDEASKYYDMAAQKNNIEAKDKWGVMFLESGVLYDKCNAKRIKEGLERVKDAAYNGYAMAQYNMGLYYKNGENGIQKDLSKAYEWFKLAAEQDNEYAQKNLGDFFLYGRGVPKDEKKACQWYEKSAEHGNENAQASLGQYYYNNKQYKSAYKWLDKAAEHGDAESLFLVGNIYYYGLEIEKNLIRAIDYYKKAAEKGNDKAQNKLGVIYYKGESEKENYDEAYQYFKKAAEQGNSLAQWNLGTCYEDGKGIKKNANEAYKWYKKAADNTSNPSAACCYKIGEYYYNKVNNEKNVITGITVAASVLVPVTNLITVPAGLIGSTLGRKMRFESFLKSEAGKEMVKYYEKGAQLGDEKCKKKIDDLKPYLKND
ncbi:MAG: sel1 repeat family protein [Clostridium sp.]|nr:sel1 repeat family protein [Clostridium sp.]